MLIPKCHEPIVKGIEILSNSSVNSMFIMGEAGIGKSYWVDKGLELLGLPYVVFKGYLSEPSFYQFIQDNNNKIIVFRDFSSLFRNKSFLDFLKSATDTIPNRQISRITMKSYEGVEDTFTFTGKLIFEANSLPKKHLNDLDAVKSRALCLEINPSQEEIREMMFSICKTDEERELTNYLLSKNLLYAKLLNLRTQYIGFQILKSNKDKWKENLDTFLDTQVSEGRKLLYRYCGFGEIRRMEFVRYLMMALGISYSTAQKKIDEYLFMGNIYSNGSKKQALISIKEFVLEGREFSPILDQ